MAVNTAYACWLQAQREGAIETEVKDITPEPLELPAPELEEEDD